MSQDREIERAEYAAVAGREWCHQLPPISQIKEDWGNVGRYLRSRDLSTQLAGLNHWFPSRNAGDHHLRVVIPGSSLIPGNRFWQARAIDSSVEKRYQSPHAPRGDAVVVVWPEDDALVSVIVEGPMDALAAAGEGCLGIALMGMTPPDDCFRLTSKLARGTMALIVADSDGLGGASKWALKLLGHGLGIKLISPAPFKDLAEAPKPERRRILGL